MRMKKKAEEELLEEEMKDRKNRKGGRGRTK
jgi:hypothetical protein